MVYRINDNNSQQGFDKYVSGLDIITQIISYFGDCSRSGGVYENEQKIKKVEFFANEAISRIKEDYSIRTDSNPILLLIDGYKKMAINGVDVSKEEDKFAEQVIKLYLGIKDVGLNMIYTYIPKFLSLYSERTKLLQNNKKITAPVARLFDFVDMSFIAALKRTERYDAKNGSYYCIKGEDEDTKKAKRMEDLKPYIPSSLYQMTLSSCKFKFDIQSLEHYIQAFLMLEYGVDYNTVYNFLKHFFDDDQMENTIKELANYSRMGEGFYRFVRKKEKKGFTREDQDFLNFAQENMSRSRDNQKERSIYEKSYEKETFESRREEDIYISLHTIKFDLRELLLDNKGDKGFIVLAPDDHFAIRNIDNPSDALTKLESFIGMTKLPQSNLGCDYIIITNNAGKISIETHVSNAVTDLQRYYLKGLLRQLSYIVSIMKLRFSDPDRRENIEEVNKCIREIKETLKARNKEHAEKKLVPGFLKHKPNNPQ